jgi:hypothetical protein
MRRELVNFVKSVPLPFLFVLWAPGSHQAWQLQLVSRPWQSLALFSSMGHVYAYIELHQ